LTRHNEYLKPVKVAGVKYRENMKKIHAEYPVEESNCELEKMIFKWHVNAQEDAHQFREQEEKINDADYIADQERRKFVSRPTVSTHAVEITILVFLKNLILFFCCCCCRLEKKKSNKIPRGS
jgi:hypothetical protein